MTIIRLNMLPQIEFYCTPAQDTLQQLKFKVDTNGLTLSRTQKGTYIMRCSRSANGSQVQDMKLVPPLLCKVLQITTCFTPRGRVHYNEDLSKCSRATGYLCIIL